MKLFAIVFLTLFSGCTQLGMQSKVVVDEAAMIADGTLQSATFAMCRAITVGAWIRAYGSDPKKAEAWRVLCAVPVTEVPSK